MTLKFNGDILTFDENGDDMELCYVEKSHCKNHTYLNEGNVYERRNDQNRKIHHRNLLVYNRNGEDGEYNILKHILLNDRDIIPPIFKMTKSYVEMEQYDGDLEQIKIVGSTYKVKNTVYEWEGHEKLEVYLMTKIKDLFTRLFYLGIHHGDLFLRNIVFKTIDNQNIDIRIIDFDCATFLSNSFDDIIKSINEDYEINISTLEEIKSETFSMFFGEIMQHVSFNSLK